MAGSLGAPNSSLKYSIMNLIVCQATSDCMANLILAVLPLFRAFVARRLNHSPEVDLPSNALSDACLAACSTLRPSSGDVGHYHVLPFAPFVP